MLAFAYTVIYFLLPRYLFNKNNRVISSLFFAGIFILILLAQYGCGWLVAWNWVNANPTDRIMPTKGSIISHHARTISLNYPIVVGFAVIIKMMKRGRLKQIETESLAREKAKAELQLLKAQIHPHFLFNTLNNIYFFTLTASQKAPEILTRLSDILGYIFNECSQPLVPLAKELKMIEDYITLEKIRYGDRLKMNVVINGDGSDVMIPPLLLIPLIENSFKHGTSKMLVKPWINLNITIRDELLYLLLSNSRPVESSVLPHIGHIGLSNVKKRLELLYPATHALNISESATGFEVFMKIRLELSKAI